MHSNHRMILSFMEIMLIIIGISSATEKDDTQSNILEETNSNDGTGNYHFRFRTSNGIYRAETGQLFNYDSSQKYVVRGSYSYIDPDGNEVVVHYKADENGYVTVKPVYQYEPAAVVAAVPGPVLASILG